MKSIARPKANALGPAIRTLRQDKGLTLAQLSEKTGLAVSTLSKLEKGHMALSYEKLILLSRGLAVSAASLLDSTQSAMTDPPRGTGRRIVQRAGDGDRVDTTSYRQAYLAAELLHKKMTPVVVEVFVRRLEEFIAEFGALIRHPGEVFALVIEGELEFHSELYAPLRMSEGDSIYFDSAMGYAFINASVGRCRVVATCAQRVIDDAAPTSGPFARMPEGTR